MALSKAVKKIMLNTLNPPPVVQSIQTSYTINFLASCMSKPSLNTLHDIDAESWGSTKPYQTFELYVGIVKNYQYLSRRHLIICNAYAALQSYNLCLLKTSLYSALVIKL